MVKNPDQRVGVFVDVSNLYHSARTIDNARVDFRAVLEAAVADRKLIRAIAYAITSESNDEEKFFDALDKSGYEVKVKELQTFQSGKKKADWDVGLAIDMIRMSESLDVLVLISGDGDYIPAVEYLQNHGNIVEVIAFGRSASSDLASRADDFLDLEDDLDAFLRS